jgi:hypothetical protein
MVGMLVPEPSMDAVLSVEQEAGSTKKETKYKLQERVDFPSDVRVKLRLYLRARELDACLVRLVLAGCWP